MTRAGYRSSGPAETAIGIEFFQTVGDGIGGRLRVQPEDFAVEERSGMPEPDPEGLFTAVVIRSRNWETNRLVRALAKRLRCSRRKVTFAGTKDKRAVTTQLFVVQVPVDYVRGLSISDVEVLDAFPTKESLRIGDLYGNRFSIVLREFTPELAEALERCHDIRASVLEEGGFPNFFGVQRFGAVRPVTHLIGRHMARGEPEKAVGEWLCTPAELEGEEMTEARLRLAKGRDYAEALRCFPKYLSFEKTLLNHLVKQPDDYTGALGRLPQNLLMMFVHAYQSYLFNRIVSERMRAGLPLNEPVEGDLVLKLDKFGLPSHDQWAEARPRNLAKLIELCGEGKAFVSAVLFGTESDFAKGEPGELERLVMEREGVERGDFILPEYNRLTSRGTRREMLAPVRALDIEPRDRGLAFEFELTKGCYATTLMREFMKCDELTRY
jgi:tRNA pseudouridine13 synthase